ncbi:MAG: helix-turn-helix domain-containing protein [Solirubrobacteraceae bacterium]
MSKTKTPNPKQAILEVLKAAPQATVAQIAVSAGVGRSTAGKMLAQLESDGEVRRTEGGRDGNRRKPDLWSLAGEQAAANDTDTKPATSAAASGDKSDKQPTPGKPSSGKDEPTASTSEPEGGKLKPNQLNPLVLGYLTDNAKDGPHSPTEIAKALQRSSGAVGNSLERLTNDKKVERVVDKPRRYAIA